MKKKNVYKYTQENCPFTKYHWKLKSKLTYPDHKEYILCDHCGWFRYLKGDRYE